MKRYYIFLAFVAMLIPIGTRAQLSGCTDTTCNVTILMEDDYGDGWYDEEDYNFYVRVYQGSTLRGSATISSGYSSQQTVSVCASDPVRLVFSGYDDYEESFFSVVTGGGDTILSNVACADYDSGDEIITFATPCEAITCPAPAGLTVTNLQSNEATIAWSARGTETSWLVSLNGGEWESISSNPYTFTNLAESTVYTVRLRAFCGVDDTSTAAMVTFVCMDSSVVSDFPYSSGFETGQDLYWQTFNSNNGWHIGSATSNGGSNALYISSSSGASNAYSTSSASFSYAVRAFDFEDAGDYAYSFDWKAYGEYSYDYLRAWIAPGSATFTAGQSPDGGTSTYNYSTATPTGWTDLGNGEMSEQSNWQNVSGIFSITTPGTYYMVFMWANDDSYGSNPPAAIDNVYVNRLSCPAPVNLAISNIDATGATVSWHPVGSETSWQISLNGDSPVTVNDTFYVATGLTAATSYSVAVEAVCGTEDVSLPVSGSFTTLCTNLDVPVAIGFEQYSLLAPVNCWTVVTASAYYYNGQYYTTPAAWYNSEYAHNSDKSLFFYPTTSANLIATPIVNHAGNDLHVSFWTKGYMFNTTGTFEAGIMTDPSDASTFQALWTMGTDSTADLEEYEFVTSSLSSTDQVCVAFRATTTGQYAYLTVDDILIEPIPSCNRPASATVSNVTTNSADIAWASSAGAGYQVAYVSGTDTIYLPGTITDTSTALTGLNPATFYHVNVRVVCSSGGYSGWREVSFSTACEAVASFPYHESFDNGTGCWTPFDVDGAGNGWKSATISDVTAYEGTGCIGSFSWNGSEYHADEWLFSPHFVLPSADTVTFSWYARVNDEYPVDRYAVLVSTTTTDTANFTLLTDITPTSNDGVWRLHTLDLSTYAGQSIYLAFHHHDSYDQNYILIDALSLTVANAGSYPPQPVQYTVSAATADATMGSATVSPSGIVNEGTQVTFTATANSGYHFVAWTSGTTQVSTANPYTATVSSNLALTATFEADGQNPPQPTTYTVTLLTASSTMGSVS
ncbi:MAG: choice-of-anchor J domain-containing protein, partial [Bacteroidales bacterium]|nr:choice-of-anchor J domain-containing protein [Bacteroidales bacterium]